MMRQNEPQYSFEQTLDECIMGIVRNVELSEKLKCSKSDLISIETQYVAMARTG